MGITMGNVQKKTQYAQKSTFMRPLNNSNVAKLFISKRSHNLICVVPYLAYPKMKMHTTQVFLNFLGYARSRTSNNLIHNLRPLYTLYFGHMTVINGSQNCTRTIRKSFFNQIVYFWLVSYFNSHYSTWTVKAQTEMKSMKVNPGFSLFALVNGMRVSYKFIQIHKNKSK